MSNLLLFIDGEEYLRRDVEVRLRALVTGSMAPLPRTMIVGRGSPLAATAMALAGAMTPYVLLHASKPYVPPRRLPAPPAHGQRARAKARKEQRRARRVMRGAKR